jgi:YidC/Oxa1 family membrane protein insertase
MLPTEIQRIILLIGLAATGYLMILAWNNDYITGAEATSYASAPMPQQAESTQQLPAADVPTAPAADTASDVPDVSLIDGAAAPVAPAAAPASSERLIKVRTDVLNLWIDRLGGDVVRVELPGYPISLDQPDLPFLLLDNGLNRTYISQSGLIGKDGTDSSGRPTFTAVAEHFELGDTDTLSVVLRTMHNGQEVKKVYDFRRNDYLFDVRYELTNTSSEVFSASLFGQIKRDDHEPPGSDSFSMGPQPYLGAALTTNEDRYEKIEFDDLEEEPYRNRVQGGWMAFLQHYFLSAWVANPEQENNFYGNRRNDGTYVFGFTAPLQEVAPGEAGVWKAQFYAGPKNQLILEKIAPNLNLTVDYGFLWWLAVPLFYLLDWLHSFSGNWGVAIILLTVLVKAVLYPLSAASYKSMANMRRVGPQMKKLQERYADDRQKLSAEMMALYKKEKVNPLGGCLPMLLPMPIFIALYWVLFESVELRQAPFFGWIDDLAVMDPFFILPLLMGASMYVQQLLSPAVGDPMQMKMMKLMPVMFTVLFLFFPAGLVLYWLVNNILGVAQQWYVIRQTLRDRVSRSTRLPRLRQHPARPVLVLSGYPAPKLCRSRQPCQVRSVNQESPGCEDSGMPKAKSSIQVWLFAFPGPTPSPVKTWSSFRAMVAR